MLDFLKRPEVLRRIGLATGLKMIPKILGSGVFGYALQTSDPVYIVKISEDVNEIRTARQVMKLRASGEQLRGIVDIKGVWKIDIGEFKPLWRHLIVRERVRKPGAPLAIVRARNEADMKTREGVKKVMLPTITKFAPELAKSIRLLKGLDLNPDNFGRSLGKTRYSKVGDLILFDF